jgi:tellurite resistance-related uncharacterized protein
VSQTLFPRVPNASTRLFAFDLAGNSVHKLCLSTQRKPQSNCRQRLMVQLWNHLVRILLATWTFISFVAGLPLTMIRSLARHSLSGRYFNQAASMIPLRRTGLPLKTQSHRLSSVAVPNNNDDDQMPKLPLDVVQYSQLPSGDRVFTATTIPKGLLHQHSTKRGSWGVIRVSQGQLEYQIHNADANDDDTANAQAAAEPVPSSIRTFILHSKRLGIIEPTILHQVRPLTDDVEFVVEFHKLPGSRHNAAP